MSTFTVNLGEGKQGDLDRHWTTVPSSAADSNPPEASPSLQRQVYVMGPNKINRLLVDGETFQDCNYWKRFAPVNATTNPGGCVVEEAFIEVTTDDGSVWSDVEAENTFPVGTGWTLAAGVAQTVDYMSTYGSYATSATIKNTGGNAMVLTLNGVVGATLTIASGDTQVFNSGDLQITSIELVSAAGSTSEILAAVKSRCTS